jgi:CheY-like chemotaxis protein
MFYTNMRILIAEDESDISHTYRLALESRNHHVTVANNGMRCLQIYHEELKKRNRIRSEDTTKGKTSDIDLSHLDSIGNREEIGEDNSRNGLTSQDNTSRPGVSPFDVVVLDYKMPGKDGMEVAREILDLNPDQRIIFASAYVQETLEDSVKQLKRVVELLQKPFEIQALIDTIEDKEVYQELKKIMIKIRSFEQDGSSLQRGSDDLSREQIRDMFECLRRIQKNRTF